MIYVNEMSRVIYIFSLINSTEKVTTFIQILVDEMFVSLEKIISSSSNNRHPVIFSILEDSLSKSSLKLIIEER